MRVRLQPPAAKIVAVTAKAERRSLADAANILIERMAERQKAKRKSRDTICIATDGER